MENTRDYKISFFAEFVDKALERDFLNYDMKRYARVIGPVTLIFAVMYMLFLFFDYLAIENTLSFILILVIRALVFMISAVIYLSIRKITNYADLVYLITAYEVIAIVSFLVILHQYESLTYLTFFSVIAINLAVYVMPNKLINAQIISAFLILSFFMFFANHVEGLGASGLFKVVAYNLMVIIFCNIGTYMTNFYKRKEFAESRELLRMSVTDSLTGIYNRTKFGEELNRWVNFSNRYGNSLSLVIFDIDDFKRVNDNYGHLIGDNVLQNIASTIKSTIRNTDIFARWGGEEFVILLPNTGIRQAGELMERVRICIEKSKYGQVENITCSFGLVALRENESAESLVQRADKLLYDAKDLGKNAIAYEDNKTEEQINTGTSASFVS